MLREGDNIKKENSERAIKDRKVIREKCMAIKQRNSLILVEMLNLKQKMVHKMYQNKVRAPRSEAEMESIVCKIRETASRIKTKKNEFYMQKQFKFTPDSAKSAEKFKPINRPMGELRKATEIFGTGDHAVGGGVQTVSRVLEA